MTARFLALYQTPADPEAFGLHHREAERRISRSARLSW